MAITDFANARSPLGAGGGLRAIASIQAGKQDRRVDDDRALEATSRGLAQEAFQAWTTGQRTAFSQKVGKLAALDPEGATKLTAIFGALDRTNFVESAYHMYNAARANDVPAEDKSLERALEVLNVRPDHPFSKGLSDILSMPTTTEEERLLRKEKIVEAVDMADKWNAYPGLSDARKGRGGGKGDAPFQKTATFLVRDKEGNQSIMTGIFDPNDGTLTAGKAGIGDKFDLVSPLGETAAEQTQRKVGQASDIEAAKEAQKQVSKLFEQYEVVETGIANIGEAITVLDDAIANDKFTGVGPLLKYVPKWTEASAKLRNIGDRLGLDIVSSVTFGQLSNKELQLALQTAMPTNLKPEELREWFVNKKRHMETLKGYLMAASQFIGSKREDGEVNTVKDWMEIMDRMKGNRDVFAPAEGGPTPNPTIPGPIQTPQKATDAQGNVYIQDENGNWVNEKTGEPYQAQ